MRILMVFNYYQMVGGEQYIYQAEADLLASRGHEVIRYTADNNIIDTMPLPMVAAKTLWNRAAYREIRSVIRREHIELMHCHNTFPLISPAAYYAAHAAGIPVVQTLHNYRLLCLNGLFYRDGHVCEDCVGKRTPWPGVVHACYRDSTAGSGVVAGMLTLHRALRTWQREVDTYIAYSHFAMQKLLQVGLPADKLVYKTNFLYPAPSIGGGEGNYALFVGRLTPEKGIETLLAAVERLGGQVKLKIVGTGSLAPIVTQAAQRLPWVDWLGEQPLEEVYNLMGSAQFLVFTSEWYETFGRVIIESLATGTPVLTTDYGAAAELVEPGQTGLRFRHGDAANLAATMQWAVEHPTELAAMRKNARSAFEENYTAEQNYKALTEIYSNVIARRA